MAVYKSKVATKDGRCYFFRIKYKDIFGEVRDYTSKKYKTLKEAENEEAKFRVNIGEEQANASNITISQAYNEYISDKAKKVKKQTLIKEDYRFVYLEPIKEKKINDFNIPTYRKWRSYIEDVSLSTESKNKVIQLLRRIIIYSNKYYMTSDSILSFIEPYVNPNELKKEMDFYTLDEFRQFISVVDDLKYLCVFKTFYFEGIRLGELQGLTWKDVDFDKNTISINKTLTTKIKGERFVITPPKTKNSNRVLPMTKDVSECLKEYKKERMKYSDFSESWFVFGGDFPLPDTTLKKRRDYYCKSASIRKIRIHDFRHSCASLLINQGASIALVSKYLGHANISITLNTYTHMFKSELDSITDKLNKL